MLTESLRTFDVTLMKSFLTEGHELAVNVNSNTTCKRERTCLYFSIIVDTFVA